MIGNVENLPLFDILVNKVISYYSTIWKDRRKDGIHKEWLDNFKNISYDIEYRERINALYLLSKFMYFGNIELRELLKCIYRDLFKYPIIQKIRNQKNDTIDYKLLNHEFGRELERTKFLGVGNPSESGVHLLYYFRQENNLSKEFFINTHEIFKQNVIVEKDINGIEKQRVEVKLRDNNITRYVFIDDFCGSGTQAKGYSKDIVENIKSLDSSIEVNYLMLFATENGLNEVIKNTKFDFVEAIFTIDESFKCFSNVSRYFKTIRNTDNSEYIEKKFCKSLCEKYGIELCNNHPLGYKNGQLLLGFFHNTPDNTLPIFWSEKNNWKPVFKRYNKIN